MKHEATAASLNSSGNASKGGELAEGLIITEHEAEQVKRANASGATPVVFVHGLWLLPSSWDRWVTLFEETGYVTLTPGWPDDPETVTEAREHPEALAGKGIRDIYAYETLSETHWHTAYLEPGFVPNVHVDVSAFLEKRKPHFTGE